MSSLLRGCRVGLELSAALLLCSGVFAAPVTYEGMQGPNPAVSDGTLNPNVVPALTSVTQAAFDQFNAAVSVLGGNAFEVAPPSGATNQLTYAPPSTYYYPAQGSSSQSATASITGGAYIVNAGSKSPLFDPSLGRYNMTTGLGNCPPAATNSPCPGHYLESTTNFALHLTSQINAFSFFVTDLGDFGGLFTLNFLSQGVQKYSDILTNSEADANGVKNGNLLFYGIAADFLFDEIDFSITQTSTNTADTDAVGFDNFVYAMTNTNNSGGTTPEPSSLALVGLALAGLGVSARRVAQR